MRFSCMNLQDTVLEVAHQLMQAVVIVLMVRFVLLYQDCFEDLLRTNVRMRY